MPEVPATVAKNIIREYTERVAQYIEQQGAEGIARAEAHNGKCKELAHAIREAGVEQANDTNEFFLRIFEAEADVANAAERFAGNGMAKAIEAQINEHLEQDNGQDH